jgi:hypothetical protein
MMVATPSVGHDTPPEPRWWPLYLLALDAALTVGLVILEGRGWLGAWFVVLWLMVAAAIIHLRRSGDAFTYDEKTAWYLLITLGYGVGLLVYGVVVLKRQSGPRLLIGAALALVVAELATLVLGFGLDVEPLDLVSLAAMFLGVAWLLPGLLIGIATRSVWKGIGFALLAPVV